MYITSGLIRQYGPTADCPKCRSVARGNSINQTLSYSHACRQRIEGLAGNDPRHRLSRVEERKTRCLAEHLEKKFGSRPDGVTPTTSGADSTNAQDVQDKTTGSSNSVKERWVRVWWVCRSHDETFPDKWFRKWSDKQKSQHRIRVFLASSAMDSLSFLRIGDGGLHGPCT